MIRKEVSDQGSFTQNEAYSGVRRSRRARVPSILYRKAVESLKKTDRTRETATHSRKSYLDKRANSTPSESPIEPTDLGLSVNWLKCLLPDDGLGTRLIELEVVVAPSDSRDHSYAFGQQSKSSLADSHERPAFEELAEPRPRRIPRYEKPADSQPGLLHLLRSAVQKVTRQIDSSTNQKPVNLCNEQALKEVPDTNGAQIASESNDFTPKKKINVHYPWKLVQPHQLTCNTFKELNILEENKLQSSEDKSSDVSNYYQEELKFRQLSNRFSSFKSSVLNVQRAN